MISHLLTPQKIYFFLVKHRYNTVFNPVKCVFKVIRPVDDVTFPFSILLISIGRGNFFKHGLRKRVVPNYQ